MDLLLFFCIPWVIILIMDKPLIKKIVSKSVRRAIAICGTQQALADKAGIVQSMVNKYMHNGSIPKAPTALRLSKAVNGELTPADFAPDSYAGIFPITTVIDDRPNDNSDFQIDNG